VDAEDNCNGNGEQSAIPAYLLLALRLLWAYSTELELAGLFKMSEKAVSKYSGMYAHQIQLLLDMVSLHPNIVLCSIQRLTH
jgi:hypothetical protein